MIQNLLNGGTSMLIGSVARIRIVIAALALVSAANVAVAADDEVKALAKAYNGFGQDIFTVLQREPGNIVFSPYSIGVAMAMTMSGASGETQSEMLSAMHFTQTPREIESANAPLAAGLHAYAKQLPAQPSPKEQCKTLGMDGAACIKAVTAAWKPPGAPTELDIANALMITPKGSHVVSDKYTTLLHKQYDAEVFRNASLKDINAWASRKTKGKIDPLLQRMNPEVIAAILDAVYFKGAWDTPFDRDRTQDASFTLETGDAVRVPTMDLRESFAFYAGEGFKAVRLPYQTQELGMIIVLPNDPKGLAKVSEKLDAEGLSKLLGDMGAARPTSFLHLTLPRFKVKFEKSLVEPMQLCGIKLAFDPVGANFDGIAGTPLGKSDIYIGDVYHSATIEVAEEGTVAAAATAVTPTRKSAPPVPTPFIVDHPFLFYIVDQKSGAVLFQGRIEDPR
jgi:serpin B